MSASGLVDAWQPPVECLHTPDLPRLPLQFRDRRGVEEVLDEAPRREE
jgi:hypothetical protein